MLRLGKDGSMFGNKYIVDESLLHLENGPAIVETDSDGDDIEWYHIKLRDSIVNLFTVLAQYVDLEEGYTLNSLLLMLEKYKLMRYVHFNIDSFFKYWKLNKHLAHKDEKILYLGLGKYLNINILNDKEYPYKELDVTIDFSGYVNFNEDDYDLIDAEVLLKRYDITKPIPIGIDLTPLLNLLDCEIKILNTSIAEELSEQHDQKITIVERNFMEFTLLEFIQGIMEELAAYGNDPEEIADLRDDVLSKMHQCKRELSNKENKT